MIWSISCRGWAERGGKIYKEGEEPQLMSHLATDAADGQTIQVEYLLIHPVYCCRVPRADQFPRSKVSGEGSKRFAGAVADLAHRSIAPLCRSYPGPSPLHLRPAGSIIRRLSRPRR